MLSGRSTYSQRRVLGTVEKTGLSSSGSSENPNRSILLDGRSMPEIIAVAKTSLASARLAEKNSVFLFSHGSGDSIYFIYSKH